MDKVMKKTIENDGKTLEVEVYYSLGGYNHFTSRSESRGYYLSVTPVKKWTSGSGVVMKEYGAFTGLKELLLEVSRKSKKSANKALELATEEKINILVNEVMKKNGYVVAAEIY